MTEDRRKRLSRYAAIPVSMLLLGGLYFGAVAVSDVRFDAAVSASDAEIQVRDGLWNYNVLTAREQRLYEAMYDAMEARDPETAYLGFVPTAEEFSAAFDAVLYDHPLFCDLVPDACGMRLTDHSAQISLAYLQDGEARRDALAEKAQSLSAAVFGSAIADAALQLHDRLTAICAYSAQEDSIKRTTAYDALILGEADGFGYALAYTLLCREAGLACAVVRGTVADGEQSGIHAWNVLDLDGVRGCTDVMWNDTAAMYDGTVGPQGIPFHGYYFLSSSELRQDHTPDNDFGVSTETDNYYEMRNLCAQTEDALEPMLKTLLSDARRTECDYVEFRVSPALALTDYALEEALTAAISAANETEMPETPLLRQINRVYHTSYDGGSITVQLFYEESEPLGEPQ